jgi:hypothetical protein
MERRRPASGRDSGCGVLGEITARDSCEVGRGGVGAGELVDELIGASKVGSENVRGRLPGGSQGCVRAPLCDCCGAYGCGLRCVSCKILLLMVNSERRNVRMG